MKLWRRFKRWYRRPFRRRKFAQVSLCPVEESALDAARFAIILPTYNRLNYIKQGLPSLLKATEDVDCSVLVWNNASSDGSKEWLDSLSDPRLTVVHHDSNIGINALARSAAMTSGTHLLQVDDDVLYFPPGFLRELLRAYLSVPGMGYLGTNVIHDEFTDGGRPPLWRSVRVRHSESLTIDYGAVGGWCTLTDRALYDSVGGFIEKPGETYFWADLDYYRKVGALGRKRGVLFNQRVYHAFRVALDAENAQAFDKTRAQRDPEGRMTGVKVESQEFWTAFRQRYGSF
ncbi:MAG: glycosyltransferase [Planctomycetota bacterium]|nr:glycosyltransferase [Planctomycetota bacterium]